MTDSDLNTIANEEEIWAPVVGYEGLYSVSNLGRVKRETDSHCSQAGKILKSCANSRGYSIVVLISDRRKRSSKYVHRLVCTAFNGLPPSSAHAVNHLNGNKQDNRDHNLEWVTQKENVLHAFRLKLRSGFLGEQNGGARLDNEDVTQIRLLAATRNLTQRRLGMLYNVHPATIGCILRGQTWKHLL